MGDLKLELESSLPLPGAQAKAGIRRQAKTGGRSLLLGLFGLLGLFMLSRESSMGKLATSLLPSSSCRHARAALFSRRGQIDWFPCPDSSETFCAFFGVPLDHLKPHPNESVSLALRMFPSTSKKEAYKGSLILNPGGPGGSGTEEVARLGRHLSTIIEGRYDILSFDPRGVNLTSPALSCFPSESLAQLFQRDVESLGLLYESQSPFLPTPAPGDPMTEGELRWAGKLDAMNRALDGMCVENGDKGILKRSSTASTARDIAAILEALGEEELSYWGFSYGTILGATFTAMFPGKVHRMVLDGVSDADLYTNNLWDWGRSAMNHTHRTLDGFLSSCLAAGPLCALSTPNSTLSTLHTRLTALRTSLHASPLPVYSPTLGAGILTTSAIQHTLFRGLYNPKTWPELAEILAQAERGEGRGIWEKLKAGDVGLGTKDPAKNVFNRSMDVTGSGLLCHSIMCSDTDRSALEDASLETLVEYLREMGEISISGQAWGEWVSQCRRWSHEGVETYRGPWTLEGGMGRPKNPILFIAMTADPVTPLSAAVKMASGFEDSASLLIQNGMGHCSLAHPSLCTAKKIREYFLKGELPEWGTECESDPGFLFPDPEAVRVVGLEEDRELREALEVLAGEGVGRW